MAENARKLRRERIIPNPAVKDSVSDYLCKCGHAWYMHRSSREWQLLNTRRKRNLTGCTATDCRCEK